MPYRAPAGKSPPKSDATVDVAVEVINLGESTNKTMSGRCSNKEADEAAGG